MWVVLNFTKYIDQTHNKEITERLVNIMRKFMDKDFLLHTQTAKTLFENYASKLPIIDYHCHVPPKEIAEDKRYSTITELWLGGDHYKWRAERSCGVPEKYITGDGSDYEKFRAYATVMPKLIGNPLYHWSHLELQRYFGYNGVLNADTCDEVWKLCNEKLAAPEMSAKNIIRNSGVNLLCTTDDPIDDLRYHKQIAEDKEFNVKVLPAWRPDKGLKVDAEGYKEYIDALSKASDTEIKDVASLKAAFIKRLDYFDSLGCRTADHGIDHYIPFKRAKNLRQLDEIFTKAYSGEIATEEEADIFRTEFLAFFGAEYSKRHWVMQLHYGVNRNPNSIYMKKLGPDTGFDCMDQSSDTARNLAKLFDLMFSSDSLPRTIVYPINPSDNAAIATILGAFQNDSEGQMPRVMQGSAWWFNDNLDGMKAQMTTFANLSAFGNFLGMLTDSRSFISYPRHEYFRRILCDLLGNWAEGGEYPADIEALANLVMDICYNNTKNYFGF